MSLLEMERIKLASTRSPWWCAGVAVLLVIGPTALLAINWPPDVGPLPFDLVTSFTQLGSVVVMVMATIAVTTEYRFGTVRTTFQAAPRRVAVLLAKTAVVTLVAAVLGAFAGFAAWGTARLLQPGADLALDTSERWRAVAGSALTFAVAAVIALAVGILLRQTAAAVAVLLVWVLLAENLVAVIPNIGPKIQQWLPFTALARFTTISSGFGGGEPPPDYVPPPLGPWASLGYVALVAAGLLALALVTAQRRDA
jgi:ABC-2 type transport system permease protein